METSTNKKPGLFYLYILKSTKDGSFYIGQCCNLSGRLSRHNMDIIFQLKQKNHGNWCISKNTELEARLLKEKGNSKNKKAISISAN